MDNAVTETVKKGLKNKVTEHNEDVKDLKVDWNPKVTYKKLEKVFERGLGAYETNPESVRPNVTSPEQWAYARVNSFLYAMKKGKYRGGKHDTDLLPKDHPIKESMKDVENGKVRKNEKCADGYEHQMPDGSWMCGREHGGDGYNSYDGFDEKQVDLLDLINEMAGELISELTKTKNAFTQEEIDETYTEYKKAVNMSYSELKRWSESKCSKKASIGTTAINRNLTLLSKKKADWTSANATEARKAIAYIARATKQPQGKNVSKECPYSKNYIALKNWAYDRNK
jgi:hypothetical protein